MGGWRGGGGGGLLSGSDDGKFRACGGRGLQVRCRAHRRRTGCRGRTPEAPGPGGGQVHFPVAPRAPAGAPGASNRPVPSRKTGHRWCGHHQLPADGLRGRGRPDSSIEAMPADAARQLRSIDGKRICSCSNASAKKTGPRWTMHHSGWELHLVDQARGRLARRPRRLDEHHGDANSPLTELFNKMPSTQDRRHVDVALKRRSTRSKVNPLRGRRSRGCSRLADDTALRQCWSVFLTPSSVSATQLAASARSPGIVADSAAQRPSGQRRRGQLTGR